MPRLVVAMMVLATMSPSLPAATSLSQYGITWTFAADMTTGQFANGDYWVVGPVTITSITPASTLVSNRVTNGSMLNPRASTGAQQGFDSSMSGVGYSASLNVARPNGSDLSAGNPLNLPAGSSLISSISHATAGNRPQLTDAAVLTVLAAPPPANSFRPPYCGTDKSIIATEADIDYSKVASLAKPASTPNLTTVANYFTRPWIEIRTEFGGREMHPINNQPNYGRDLSDRLELGLLSLQLDYTNAQKRDLMVRLVQYGLDVYGAAVSGGIWLENGGHNQGRKMPLLLAATVLNNSAIRAYGDAAQHHIFQEDRQTFFVSQKEVTLTNSISWDPDARGGLAEPYTVADIGLAEWGILHVKKPAADNKEWGTTYRNVSCSATVGHVLTAHIMGLRSVWNWEPLFFYYDRYFEREKNSRAVTNYPTQFEKDMWNAYRGTTVVGVPVPPTPPPPVILPPTGAAVQIEVQP
jgi:hypothetical protein